LEGLYDSISALKKDIKRRFVDEVFEEVKIITEGSKPRKIGKCCKCHHYNEGIDKVNRWPNYVKYGEYFTCNYCNSHTLSKWGVLSVEDHDYQICTCEGGSICRFDKQALYRFV